MSHATAHPEGLDVAFGIDPAKPALIKRSPASFFNSPLTFEQWMRRPVYVAQCKTWKTAKALGVCCLGFRCLPGYRDANAQHARKLVADMVRRERQRIAL